MNWIHFSQLDQIPQIIEKSYQVPCLIFKHSTRCNISSIAKYRLENQWTFSITEMAPYYLDLITYRDVSNNVAKELEVYHESPQIIVIWNGEVILDASHLDISVDEIKEVLDYNKIATGSAS